MALTQLTVLASIASLLFNSVYSYGCGTLECKFPDEEMAYGMGIGQRSNGSCEIFLRDGKNANAITGIKQGQTLYVNIRCPFNFKGYYIVGVHGVPGVPHKNVAGKFWDLTVYETITCEGKERAAVTQNCERNMNPYYYEVFWWEPPADVSIGGGLTFYAVIAKDRTTWYGKYDKISSSLPFDPAPLSYTTYRPPTPTPDTGYDGYYYTTIYESTGAYNPQFLWVGSLIGGVILAIMALFYIA